MRLFGHVAQLAPKEPFEAVAREAGQIRSRHFGSLAFGSLILAIDAQRHWLGAVHFLQELARSTTRAFRAFSQYALHPRLPIQGFLLYGPCDW